LAPIFFEPDLVVAFLVAVLAAGAALAADCCVFLSVDFAALSFIAKIVFLIGVVAVKTCSYRAEN
jgi:hypothetical protein